MTRENPKFKEILRHEETGTFIKDEGTNEGFILNEDVLSKVTSEGINPIKKFSLDDDIANLAKRGDEISILLQNDELLFFEGDSLKWRQSGKSIGIPKLVFHWIFMLLAVGSIFLVFGLALLNLLLAVLVLIVNSVILLFLLHFFPSTEKELFLGDINEDEENEVILNVRGELIIFLDHSTGTVLKTVNIKELGYSEGKIISPPEKREKVLWIRAKKIEKDTTEYYALTINFDGIKKVLKSLHLIEVFDWNNDGEKELASVSRKKVQIFSRKGELLTEKESPLPIAAYKGDLNGDGKMELALLGRKGERFSLHVLKGDTLCEYAFDFSPLFLLLVGTADTNTDGKDEVLLKSFFSEKIEFLVYEFTPK